MKCRIVLVESRLPLRNGLLLLLNAMPSVECLATFPNAASALAALPQVQPDVVITALDLPDIVGSSDATAYLRRLSPEGAPILILTNAESDELLTRCIESGAMGYVPKGAPPSLLQEIILNLASARADISAPSAHLLLDRLAHLPRKYAATFSVVHQADIRLLDLFAHGYTNKDIAEQLTLAPNDLQTRTFRLLRHIQKLYWEMQKEVQKELHSRVIDLPLRMEEAA